VFFVLPEKVVQCLGHKIVHRAIEADGQDLEAVADLFGEMSRDRHGAGAAALAGTGFGHEGAPLRQRDKAQIIHLKGRAFALPRLVASVRFAFRRAAAFFPAGFLLRMIRLRRRREIVSGPRIGGLGCGLRGWFGGVDKLLLGTAPGGGLPASVAAARSLALALPGPLPEFRLPLLFCSGNDRN